MVGGFVQQQQLRLGQQQPRKTQARLFAAGQYAGGVVFAPLRKAQSREHALHTAGPFIAALGGEAIQQR